MEKGQDHELLNEEETRKYQHIVGLLLWAARNTRPDLAFAVNSLGAKCSNRNTEDQMRLRWCLAYVVSFILPII